MIGSPTMVKSPIAVFAHVHYPDIWAEMAGVLAARIGLPFHLVLSSSHPEHQIVLPSTPNLVSTRFVPTENRGRDIRPFLEALSVTEDFEFGLKLHTKKSPQRADGRQWREEVLASLLPPRPGVEEIVARMQADRRVGLVTPAGFALSVKPWILVNAPGMEKVMHCLGHELTEDKLEHAYFAAGSMFWFRRPALASLAGDKVLALFEPEQGQFDGTIAHAMERLFPVEARRQGYASLSLPALMESTPSLPEEELRSLAKRHADIPSTYFPAPYRPALPPGTSLDPPVPGEARPSLPRAIYARLPAGVRSFIRAALLRGQPGSRSS